MQEQRTVTSFHTTGDCIVGILLCDRPVAREWCESLNTLMERSALKLGFHFVQNLGKHKLQEIVEARTAIAEWAVKSNARYLFFLDDDVYVPAGGLAKLIQALEVDPKARIIGGLYFGRGHRNVAKAMVWNGSVFDGSLWQGDPFIYSWEPDSVFECGGCGSGCMLIDVSVFRELPQPWFDFDCYTGAWADDDYFTSLVTAAGYKVLCHSGVVCEHRSTFPIDGMMRDVMGKIRDKDGNEILPSQI